MLHVVGCCVSLTESHASCSCSDIVSRIDSWVYVFSMLGLRDCVRDCVRSRERLIEPVGM